MPTGQALLQCPELLLISGSYGDYSSKSRQVMGILAQLTALVEQISIDEAFLDVTDLPEEPERIAVKLQQDVLRITGLPCSIGVASNKLVAKMATDAGKSCSKKDTYPQAILVVPNGKEAEFLAPLHTKAMWGVGPKMEIAMANAGMGTLGDIALQSKSELVRLFGKYGGELYDRVRGIDDRPVIIERDIKSISQEITFFVDSSDLNLLRQTLKDLSSQVGYRLRQEGLSARVIRLKIRWSDFSTHTRQISLAQPTHQDGVIYTTAESLFIKIWENGKPVRLIGVGGTNLEETSHQMSLWETPTEKERRLLDALDEIREKFGSQAVRKANKIKPES